MNYSSWWTRFVPSLVITVLIYKRRCELLLRTQIAAQGLSDRPTAAPSLYQLPPTAHMAIAPRLPRALASTNRISAYTLSQWRPIGPERNTSVPATGRSPSQTLESRASSVYSLHLLWLVQNRSEAWRIQDWLITISIPLGLLVPFQKFHSACQLLPFIKGQWNISTICLLLIWVSNEKCI